MLYSSTIYDKNGTTFSYIVDDFKENPVVHPSRFSFNSKDYPGVTEIDMR
jgi:outer membrane lipoprotein-sorting protein